MADTFGTRESTAQPSGAPGAEGIDLSRGQSLQGVSRTLLIPLYARARARELLPEVGLDDPVARQVVNELALDDVQAGKDRFTARLCIARSALLQRALLGLLQGSGSGAEAAAGGRSIVLLACGLDTLPNRLAQVTGGPAVTPPWLCTDLPEVIALRDELLPPGGVVANGAASLPDDLDAVADWLKLHPGRPVFVLEGILPYLERDAVVRTLAALAELAPSGADLLVDGYHPALLAFARFGDAFRRMRVRFRFAVADAADYEGLSQRVRVRAQWDLLADVPLAKRRRTLLPGLFTGGKPLASLAQLELLPS
jgi:O-methyltransferase involved in polyketide biosynthesis